ncbi:MAG TPA: sulfatase-like hydrolase/transferase [Myxococcota bacterium]
MAFLLLEIFAVAALALATQRLVPQPWRGRVLGALKLWLTVRVFWLLLTHPVKMEDGSKVVAYRLVLETLAGIDQRAFWAYCALAAGIKFVGILASMYRWTILLRGQGIALPFRHIFGSFLIGRFIGTFLPSTLGLDGYTLYDAARFSGRTVEATAAKFLEKVIGPIGIFLSFLVALPFGMNLLYEHTEIFPTRGAANTAALASAAVSLAIVGALLALLWFPGIVQWGIEHLPLPGKARLAGLVARVSRAAGAYKDHKLILLEALALSFVVHFTTAAMYYFTALAIGAVGAQFWPVVLGSTVQILATVLSPITIAGEGIRELAQLLVLSHMIGAGAAVISAALGFWAAEGLTLFGAIFWWIRKPTYTPAWCRVDGQQVDYAQAAKAAVSLEPEGERAGRLAATVAPPLPLAARVRLCAGLGLGSGIVAGVLIAAAESFVIARGGFGGDAQVLWFAPLAYAAVLGGLGLAGGAVLAMLPMSEDEARGWTPSLAWLATLVPVGLAITLFRLRRDVFAEQMPPLPVLAAMLGAAALLALALFLLGPRLFRGRIGAIARPLPALLLLAAAVAGGALAGRALAPEPAARPAPPPVPAALAKRPNVILVMVDTLRADHLSCYGSREVETPALCSLAADGGTIFDGFSHASWTKPAAASLLTSLLPSTHGAVAKTSVLPAEVVMLAEAMQQGGYATGGIASNINLAESFGFDQGYDEYHYLAPDYLAGAKESSSKLILYQIARSVWFKLRPGLRVGDFYQDAATVNSVAFDFLERHRASRFFLFLHYMDPHDPYFEHPKNGVAIARVANPHPSPALAAEMKRLYAGEVRYLDEHFALLLAKLRELGVYDDTLIALTADHGEEFHEHGGFWHGLTLYDEQIRVPLLVKWPKGAPAAPPSARGHLSRLIDVAPTLLARAGIQPPAEMQGIDLATPLEQRTAKDRSALSEEDHEGNVLRALRTPVWKLIEANPGNPRGLAPKELYQVAEDPGETRNRIGEQAEQARALREQAEAEQQLARSRAAGGGGAAELSDAQQEALKALGYAE